MAILVCVGGPKHRDFHDLVGDTFVTDDGHRYYKLRISIPDGTGKKRIPFYVYEDLYHDKRDRNRLAVEAAFHMTWDEPTEAGLYWVRWSPSWEVSLVHVITEPGFALRVEVGHVPQEANPANKIFSLQPLSPTAGEIINGDDPMALCLAADWCSENDHPRDAKSLRRLARQLIHSSKSP